MITKKFINYENKNKFNFGYKFVFFQILFIVFFAYVGVSESATKIELVGNSYESEKNSNYRINDYYKTSQMGFGKAHIGSVNLSQSGGIEKNESNKDNFPAYKAKGAINIQYGFEGNFKSDQKEKWQIVSDSGKEVADIHLSGKIQDGVMIIRRKIGYISWETVAEYTNFFGNKKLDRKNLYSIPEDELKKGAYYQIIIAYKIERKAGEEPGFLGFKKDIMIQRYCIEYYEFFAYYADNLVTYRDIVTSKAVQIGEDNTLSGFILNKNDSSYEVKVSIDGSESQIVGSSSTFTVPGRYSIIITDPLGAKYSQIITVDRGLSLSNPISPEVYVHNKKEGYTTERSTESGPGAHTSLMIGQPGTAPFTNNSSKYGVSGEIAYVFLRLNNFKSYERFVSYPTCHGCDPTILPSYPDILKIDTISRSTMSNNWKIVSDDYGKKDSQKIKDTYTGLVKTGALIIRTSKDGKTWNSINSSHYAKGLFTTDFEQHYGSLGDIPIYMPSGQDILDGIYIQVLYAYEVKNESQKKDLRIVEQYYVYLCSDNLKAVTFHNLSAGDVLEQNLEGYDEATAEIYKHAETMLSEAYTVSGFEIDRTLNPTVTYTLTKDGEKIYNQRNNNYTDTGKYVISLKNPVGTERTVTLYVDRMTDKEAFDFYFGESFIRGKRIYSEGQYPVYEGGHTSYFLNEVDENHVPLGGYIKNLTTDETINIKRTRERRTGNLISPGEYIAVFNTNPIFVEDPQSGDCREFTFHFRVIAEGTAPGPVVNKKILTEKYAHTTITDSYPIYYGLIYPSSTKGNITLAFATRDTAVQYAKEHEKDMVERQSDGSYRYNGSYKVSQKEKYESNWDLMDAIDYFAQDMVHELYFDLSDEYTVLSLADDIISTNDNLRKLELDRSVVIFADGQKPLLTNLNALPIISPKPYMFVEPGLEGNIIYGFEDFEFIYDKYFSDSYTVVILDESGKEYSIEYNKGVGEQLSEQKCPSGIVTIRESTIHGDIGEYQAVFIADGDNKSEITLKYFENGEEKQRIFTQADNGTVLTTDAFVIFQLVDPLDPYNLVLVNCKQDKDKNSFFVADQIPSDIRVDAGDYVISVVNRLGYGYKINIVVRENDMVTIHFSGIGTEKLEDIQVPFGTKVVELPTLERYGYDFIGYADELGNFYNEEISTILFRGASVLNAVWKAKEFSLILQDTDGDIISSQLVSFGTPVTLPGFEAKDGYTFEGWLYDGQVLSENSFVLETESDITLIPFTKKAEVQPTEEMVFRPTEAPVKVVVSETKTVDGTTNSNSAAIITGCGIAVLVIAAVIVSKNKKQPVNVVSEEHTTSKRNTLSENNITHESNKFVKNEITDESNTHIANNMTVESNTLTENNKPAEGPKQKNGTKTKKSKKNKK